MKLKKGGRWRWERRWGAERPGGVAQLAPECEETAAIEAEEGRQDAAHEGRRNEVGVVGVHLRLHKTEHGSGEQHSAGSPGAVGSAPGRPQ